MGSLTNFYRDKKVVVTGHTGFKGSWLCLWLQKMGAEVIGLSLPAKTTKDHIELIELDIEEHFVDIRDQQAVKSTLQNISPDIIFHLAACTLVRQSYSEPLVTWQTNVQGTANLLDACRHVSKIKTILVVTTDKVYENKEWSWGYRENDPLLGAEPYSASKAATEILVNSYITSYFEKQGIRVATARAGNVIGGGDWAEDRLIPDIFRAYQKGTSVEIRNPKATRPWQHVLDCLHGYLILTMHLHQQTMSEGSIWNFGPEPNANLSVESCLNVMQEYLPNIEWRCNNDNELKESQLLYLDSSKANQLLNWHSIWDFKKSISMTAAWYRAYIDNAEVITEQQLDSYLADVSQTRE